MKTFFTQARGVIATEYGLIAALVTVMIIPVLELVATELELILKTIQTAVSNAISVGAN